MKVFKNKSVDDNLKSKANISLYHLEPSKNIFEEAWLKKDEKITIGNFIFKRHPVKIVLTAACCMFISLTAIFTYFPSARAIAAEAYNNIRTIFALEKTPEGYKIVEETEDKALPYENIGGINVDENNKAKLEERLGFSINYPKKLGEEFHKTSDANVGVQVLNITLKEVEDLRDKFMKALVDDQTFQELSKYKMKPFVDAAYSDKNGFRYILYSSKITSETMNSPEVTVLRKVDIENIQCNIVEVSQALYTLKEDGFWCSDDITKKPTEIVSRKYLNWEYEGASYSITTRSNEFNVDIAIKLAQEYMKNLKGEHGN